MTEGNPGSWVNYDENPEFNESVDNPLFVPNAAQTGYKAESEQPFVVPENGTVAITAEFDVRKALVDPQSAEALRISRQGLKNKMKRYGVYSSAF